MVDRLSELLLCEDNVVLEKPTPTSVIFKGLWGSDSYGLHIVPLLERLAIREVKTDLSSEGVMVTFETMREATLARMFFEGETAGV